MKIVSEYLKEGVEFVEGDWVIDDNDVIHWYNWYRSANKGMFLWMDDTVINFTWRNSTGTPPTYTNLVEVKQRNGIVYVDYVKNIDFTLELSDDDDVVQWKPYIECDLDWHLGRYSKFVDICVHIKPTVHTLWKNPKFYKYNRGE